VTDLSNTLNDARAFITVNAAHATHFLISGPDPVVAGVSNVFTITAQDPFNNTTSRTSGRRP